MATFTAFEVLPEARGQSIWADIKHELVAADSVEVVKRRSNGTVTFELHVWFGFRRDGSNRADADSTRSY